jgi:hypothetical protein
MALLSVVIEETTIASSCKPGKSGVEKIQKIKKISSNILFADFQSN